MIIMKAENLEIELALERRGEVHGVPKERGVNR